MISRPILERVGHFLRNLRAGADAARRAEYLINAYIHETLMSEILLSQRYRDPLRLFLTRSKVFSQNYEDGMIATIFSRIGIATKTFVEIGVENGLECNTAYLLVNGWSGVWIEADHEKASAARRAFGDYPIDVIESLVTAENADGIVAKGVAGGELDLLSIDIDSSDYWVWKAVASVTPRVVIIEYNASFPPSDRKAVKYDPSRSWDGSNYFGATLGALEALGREKGYSLVGCTINGVNAFFVRNDLVGDRFCAPFTAENHYEPPRYFLAAPGGHRPGIGLWINV